MSDLKKQMIQDIATKHGVVLGTDDPILIIQTINQRLMDDSRKAQEALLEQYKQEWEYLVTRWDVETNAKAERILNATLAASQQVLTRTFQEGTVLFRQEVDDALKHAQTQRRVAYNLSMWNVAAAAMTLLATGVVAWTMLGH